MAYSKFHQCHPDFEGTSPVFHDTDGSPVYEHPYGSLLCSIIENNDTTALHLYNDCPYSEIFWQAYEASYHNPFSTALACRSFDVLRALIRMYRSDTSLTEPLEKYLKKFYVSLIHEACSAADRDLAEWLMNHDPPLGTLHDRTWKDRSTLLCAAEALGEMGGHTVEDKAGDSLVVARQKVRKDRDRIEAFIYWLLKSGCSVSESDAFERDFEHNKDSEDTVTLTGTVLCAAIPYASKELVSHLIANGANVHARQVWISNPPCIYHATKVTPLHVAASYSNLEAMQTLMDLRGTVELSEMVSMADGEGRLPLHWALHCIADSRLELNDSEEVISRMIETVKTLLEIKPDTVNARDRHGATTFHYAVQTGLGHLAVPRAIELLLSATSLPNILNMRNGRGSTALGEVARPFSFFGGSLDGLPSLVQTLITKGADARLCASKGRSFLHVLCSYSWHEPLPTTMLDFILETVDVNQTDDDGCTALHYLVKNLGQGDAIRHLISRGADVTVNDKNGNTPLHELMKGKIPTKMYANWEVEPLPPQLLQRTQEQLIQALVDAGTSMDQVNKAGKTPQQILDGVLEERGRQQQQDVAWSGQGSEDLVTKQDRGRVIGYVDTRRYGARGRRR